MTNEVTIHVKAKDDASKTFKQVEGSAKRLDGNVKKMAGVIGAAAGVAGAAMIKFGVDSVKAASDMNETMNKTQVVFGKNASEITKWSRNSAEKLGLSQQAALAAASSFGLMFKQLGSSGGESVKLSQKVVKLAADLGSFHNLDTADVMDRISAAFRGEYDSLQQLVPTINAARVEKEALAQTGKTNAKSLTAEEKAMAALSIITKDSAAAQNDFAETSDGLANKTKILTAKLEDMKAKIGEALLPVVSDMATEIGNMFDNWEDSGQMAEDLEDLATAARDVQEAFKGFGKANRRFADGMEGQRREILKWRIKMLESILAVVEGWALINPRMKSVAKHLRESLAAARADFDQTTDEINRKKIIPKIKANISELEAKVRAAKKRLKETDDKKTKPKINAEISSLVAAVAIAKAQLASIKNKTVFISTVRTGSGRTRGDAHGGNIGAPLPQAATGGMRGQQVLVGEQGPEIVDLPFGSHVNSNPDSQRIMAGGRGGSVTININAPGVTDTNGLRRMLVDMHRRGELDVVLR